MLILIFGSCNAKVWNLQHTVFLGPKTKTDKQQPQIKFRNGKTETCYYWIGKPEFSRGKNFGSRSLPNTTSNPIKRKSEKVLPTHDLFSSSTNWVVLKFLNFTDS